MEGIKVKKFLLAVFLLGATGLSTKAHAKLVAGLHGELTKPLGDTAGKLGPGFGFVSGYQLNLQLIKITPEVGVSYYLKSGTLMPKIGGRATIGKFVEGGFYAHALVASGREFDGVIPGFDAGLILDITAIPKIDVGAHGGVLFTGDGGPGAPNQSLVAGLHLYYNF